MKITVQHREQGSHGVSDSQARWCTQAHTVCVTLGVAGHPQTPQPHRQKTHITTQQSWCILGWGVAFLAWQGLKSVGFYIYRLC